jgi:hypothetical protein
MNVLEYTIHDLISANWPKIWKFNQSNATTETAIPATSRPIGFDPWHPLRHWLDRLEIRDRHMAHWLCQHIPAQCPFERDIHIGGKVLFHIPPMCKLNPLYEEVVTLRFRALCYLADECGEDISLYC